jgi:hypothetical protein
MFEFGYSKAKGGRMENPILSQSPPLQFEQSPII